MSSVVVVGAGIVGASITYHLARLGVPVTLIDRAAAPGDGVTADSFAWIGDRQGDWPGGADDLRHAIRADYRRLEAEVPGVTVRWTGSLVWTAGARPGPGQTWAARAEIEQREPHLADAPERAVHSPGDGGVDPVRLTHALVDAARKEGAEVVLGAPVTAVRAGGVESTAGFHPGETVVLAAGTGIPALCPGVPVDPSPARRMRIATPPGLVRTILSGPDFEARENRPGELLATTLGRGGAAFERLRAAFPGAEPFRLLDSRVGLRPMPPGGPRIGYANPGRPVYIAVMHSAICLAPTAGRLIARELATGTPAPELRHCRP